MAKNVATNLIQTQNEVFSEKDQEQLSKLIDPILSYDNSPYKANHNVSGNLTQTQSGT